jgi:putative proteasome-type protease
MTYCLGIITRTGLIMAADSRTNAGIDYISTYQKLFDFSVPGDRALLLCTSGNLSLSQAVLKQLERDLLGHSDTHLHSLPTLYEIARYIGEKVRHLQETDRSWLKQDGIEFHCNFLIGGQIRGGPVELYLVYSQGNCIHATEETPYLQIGETKYGKPILDRVVAYETSLDTAAKCALLSLDSTMRSNLSVGPPLRLVRYRAGSLKAPDAVEFPAGAGHLIKMRREWESALREAFERLPDIPWPSSERCSLSSSLVVAETSPQAILLEGGGAGA